jgi:hypothetical protein
MSNRAAFRLAIIGLLAYELAIGAALYFFDDGTLDPAWELLPETIGWYTYFESHFIASIAVGVAVILIIVTGLVGVLMFQNWGRWLYLASTVLIFPISMFTGATIYYGWESALWDTANMANGAIILAMFLPPISNEFNKLSQQDAASGASA